jgi:hypothetical protein
LHHVQSTQRMGSQASRSDFFQPSSLDQLHPHRRCRLPPITWPRWLRGANGVGITPASRWPIGEVHELDLHVTSTVDPEFPAATLSAHSPLTCGSIRAKGLAGRSSVDGLTRRIAPHARPQQRASVADVLHEVSQPATSHGLYAVPRR